MRAQNSGGCALLGGPTQRHIVRRPRLGQTHCECHSPRALCEDGIPDARILRGAVDVGDGGPGHRVGSEIGMPGVAQTHPEPLVGLAERVREGGNREAGRILARSEGQAARAGRIVHAVLGETRAGRTLGDPVHRDRADADAVVNNIEGECVALGKLKAVRLEFEHRAISVVLGDLPDPDRTGMGLAGQEPDAVGGIAQPHPEILRELVDAVVEQFHADRRGHGAGWNRNVTTGPHVVSALGGGVRAQNDVECALLGGPTQRHIVRQPLAHHHQQLHRAVVLGNVRISIGHADHGQTVDDTDADRVLDFGAHRARRCEQH